MKYLWEEGEEGERGRRGDLPMFCGFGLGSFFLSAALHNQLSGITRREREGGSKKVVVFMPRVKLVEPGGGFPS